MPLKGKQIQSTPSHMEPLKASHSALANDVPFPKAQVQEANMSLNTDAQAPATGGSSEQYWTVQVRNNQGELKEAHLGVDDVWLLPDGEKVMIPFDGSEPIGKDEVDLLFCFLCLLGYNHKRFPISFKSWNEVPGTFKDEVWKTIIKEKFWWDPMHEDAALACIMKEIGIYWRERRRDLFRYCYDPTISREENIKNPPSSIPETEWATFIDYKLMEKEIREKNSQKRNKHEMDHTSCSKKPKREKIMETESQETSSETEDSSEREASSETETSSETISPNNSSPIICPTHESGSSYQQYNTGGATSCNGEKCNAQKCNAQLRNDVEELKMEIQTQNQRISRLEVLVAQLYQHYSLHIPPELAPNLDISGDPTRSAESSSSQSSTHFSE